MEATFHLAKPRHPGDIAGLVLDLYETESQLNATVLGHVVPLARGAYGIALRFSGTDTQLPSARGWPVQLLIESGGRSQDYHSAASCPP